MAQAAQTRLSGSEYLKFVRLATICLLHPLQGRNSRIDNLAPDAGKSDRQTDLVTRSENMGDFTGSKPFMHHPIAHSPIIGMGVRQIGRLAFNFPQRFGHPSRHSTGCITQQQIGR